MDQPQAAREPPRLEIGAIPELAGPGSRRLLAEGDWRRYGSYKKPNDSAGESSTRKPSRAIQKMTLIWPYVAAGLNLAFALVASAHVVLTRAGAIRASEPSDGWASSGSHPSWASSSTFGWGSIASRTARARSLRPVRSRFGSSAVLSPCPKEVLGQALTPGGAHLEQLVKLGDDVSQRHLLAGNRVTPLVNGDQAYPAMLEAIDQAARSVTLTTYIFRNDPMGQQFLEALRRAVLRKVEVRVLIDDVGARYSWRPMPRLLRAGRNPVRTVPANAHPAEVSLFELENSPEDPGGRWDDRFHRRNQHR